MDFFKSKPHAVAHTNPLRAPDYETPEMKKRREDEEICARRLCASREAHQGHKTQLGIDNWDFVEPGPSAEEQKWAADIFGLYDIRDKTWESAKDKTRIIIRAGFRTEEPTKYLYFIAGLGTMKEMTHEAMDPDCYYGEGESMNVALERLYRKLKYARDMRARMDTIW